MVCKYFLQVWLGFSLSFWRFYLFIRERKHVREKESTGRQSLREKRSRLGAEQGARSRTRSQDAGILTWAEADVLPTEPPRCPLVCFFKMLWGIYQSFRSSSCKQASSGSRLICWKIVLPLLKELWWKSAFPLGLVCFELCALVRPPSCWSWCQNPVSYLLQPKKHPRFGSLSSGCSSFSKIFFNEHQ